MCTCVRVYVDVRPYRYSLSQLPHIIKIKYFFKQGSTKIAQFTVPVMTGRWSRFAIGVNGTCINLHLYCQQNYAREEYKRSYSRLKFMEDSYLLVGHGGDIFNEQFKVITVLHSWPIYHSKIVNQDIL